MRHANPSALEKLERLLEQLRECPGLKERSAGIFYLQSKPFLHFHFDPSGIFADVKLDLKNFSRLRASTAREQIVLLQKIDETLNGNGRSRNAC